MDPEDGSTRRRRRRDPNKAWYFSNGEGEGAVVFFPRAEEDTEHREGWLGDGGAFARRVSVGDIDWRATGAGSVGRTIGRFSSALLGCF